MKSTPFAACLLICLSMNQAKAQLRDPEITIQCTSVRAIEQDLFNILDDVGGGEVFFGARRVFYEKEGLSWLDRTRSFGCVVSGDHVVGFLPITDREKTIRWLGERMFQLDRDGAFVARSFRARVTDKWILIGRSSNRNIPEDPTPWLNQGQPHDVKIRIMLDRMDAERKKDALNAISMAMSFVTSRRTPVGDVISDARRAVEDLTEIAITGDLDREGVSVSVDLLFKNPSEITRRLSELTSLRSQLPGLHTKSSTCSLLFRTVLPERNRDRLFAWAADSRRLMTADYGALLNKFEERALVDLLRLMGGEQLDAGVTVWRDDGGQTGALLVAFRSFSPADMRRRVERLKQVVSQRRANNREWQQHTINDAQLFEIQGVAPPFPEAANGPPMDVVVGYNDQYAFLATGNECLRRLREVVVLNNQQRDVQQPLAQMRLRTRDLIQSYLPRVFDGFPDPPEAWFQEARNRDEMVFKVVVEPQRVRTELRIEQLPLRMAGFFYRRLLEAKPGADLLLR